MFITLFSDWRKKTHYSKWIENEKKISKMDPGYAIVQEDLTTNTFAILLL